MSALNTIKSKIKNTIISLKGDIPDYGPDFFIIGVTRAGTTYLHHLLNEHPDIFMPQNKELHYFNHDGRYHENLKGYLCLFNGYKKQKIIGEATPLYFEKGTYYDKNGKINFFKEETTIKRLHKHFPRSKLIISVRDPISRILSLHTKNFYQGKVTTSLFEEIQQELEGNSRLNLLYRNRYNLHLEEIFKYYPHDSVHIMIFEEWIKNPTSHLNDLSKFLGIAPLGAWPNLPKKKNTAEEYRKQENKKIENKIFEIDNNLKTLILNELNPSRQYLENLIGKRLPWENTDQT